MLEARPSRAVHLSMRKTLECTANRTAKDVSRRRQGMIALTNSIALPECFRALIARLGALLRCQVGALRLHPSSSLSRAPSERLCERVPLNDLWAECSDSSAVFGCAVATEAARRRPAELAAERARARARAGREGCAPRPPAPKFYFLFWLCKMAGAVGSVDARQTVCDKLSEYEHGHTIQC